MEDEKVIAQFGHRLRVRVCGVCVDADKILMVKHSGLGKTHLWAPPGGGVKYAESLEEALKREFLEETCLEIEIEKYLFTHEFLAPPLHAVEFFFKVNIIGGELKIGVDPEMKNEQIIEQVSFQDFNFLMTDLKENLHPAMRNTQSLSDFLNMKGFYSYQS